MANICKKCGGIIADVYFDHEDRNDCKCHRKPDVDIEYVDPWKREKIK